MTLGPVVAWQRGSSDEWGTEMGAKTDVMHSFNFNTTQTST